MATAGISLAQARSLANDNAKMVEKQKRERFLAKVNTERAIETVAGLVASPVAGYVSGMLDTKFDDGSGDGIVVMGMPAVPLGGAVVAGLGFFMGGASGRALVGAGLATVHGGLFLIGFKKGQGQGQ